MQTPQKPENELGAPPSGRAAKGAQSLLPLDVYLKQCQQTHMLQHFLGHSLPYAPAALANAIFVGLDVEWFERGNKDITELGVCVIDLPASYIPTGNPWDILKYMQTYHLRISETAHMINTEYCPGRPDKFLFGSSEFVFKESVAKKLKYHFWPEGDRPVIFLGHAVENDIEVIKEHFGIDLNAHGNIVATLDTQVMAQEAGIGRPGQLIKLRDLLKHFGIKGQWLHNGGNDIAYTMIAAFITASWTLRGLSPASKKSLRSIDHQAKINELWTHIDRRPCGPNFCTRCFEWGHPAERCYDEEPCENCSSSEAYQEIAYMHRTKNCPLLDLLDPSAESSPGKVVVPCQTCVLSTDPKRWRKADTHVDENCPFTNEQEQEGGDEASAV
jgi:hypothetical protein